MQGIDLSILLVVDIKYIFLTKPRVSWPGGIPFLPGASAYAERLEKGDGLDETERPRAAGDGNPWETNIAVLVP